MRILLTCLVALGPWIARAAEPPPEALLVIVGDSHSAYDKVAQFVAHLDRLKEENRHVPLGILVNGDAFELGNAVAKRSNAEIDLAFLAALAKRGPTILNLGNHEMDFFGPAEAVQKIAATGVVVVSGNARNHATGEPLAPASTPLLLGAYEATVVGVVTERLNTFRKAIQPELDLSDPVVWARQNFPLLLKDKMLPIVLSHAGVSSDRQMLDNYPALWAAGSLFAGAHDHLRFMRNDHYVHSGSWLEYFTVAKLIWAGMPAKRLQWRLEQVRIDSAGPADPELAMVVKRVRAQHLTMEDNAVVGYLEQAMPVQQAAQFAAEAVARAAGGDTAFIGNTTFGAGLPAGPVTQLDFDACVRFDGPVYTALVDGVRLVKLLETANERGPATAFDRRNGEFNFAGGRMERIEADKGYRIVTSDWGAKNSDRYFGTPAIEWQEHPTVKLKAAVLAALARTTTRK